MATYNLIASTTIGSGAPTSIDFTSIPQTYTDLLIKTSLRSTSTTIDVKITFNSTTTGYSRKSFQADTGTGSVTSTSSSDAWIGTIDGSSQTANTFGNSEIYIPNYASAKNKSYSVMATIENNAAQVFLQSIAGTWTNTAAITSISISALTGSLSFAQYSTAYLYGISNS